MSHSCVALPRLVASCYKIPNCEPVNLFETSWMGMAPSQGLPLPQTLTKYLSTNAVMGIPDWPLLVGGVPHFVRYSPPCP